MFESWLSTTNENGQPVWGALTAGTPMFCGKIVGFETSLFCFGGATASGALATVRKFNLLTNTWATVATLPWVADSMCAVVIGGLIYVYGGGDGNSRFGNLVSFNPVTNAIVPLLAGAPCRGASAVAIDGKMYVYGGSTSSTVILATLRCYDPATNTWTTLAPSGTLPGPKYYACEGVVNGKMVIAGGGGGAAVTNWSKTIETYDPVLNTWEASVPMVDGVYGAGGGVVGKRIYAVGGVQSSVGPSDYVKTVRAFDTETKSWVNLKDQAKALGYTAGGVLDGKLYLYGGYSLQVPTGPQGDLNSITPV